MPASLSPHDAGALSYHCPRCRARTMGHGPVPPDCAACGLPLAPEDAAPPPDTRGHTSRLFSLGVVLVLGFIIYRQWHLFGEPLPDIHPHVALSSAAPPLARPKSDDDLARERSEAIRLCASEARARLGTAFDDAPIADDDVRRDGPGEYRVRSHAEGAESLAALARTGFACRVQQVDGEYGGWEITEFAVQGDTGGPALIPTPATALRR